MSNKAPKKEETVELTLEQAMERIAELEAVIVERDQKIEVLENNISETAQVIEKKLHIVPGTYKSEKLKKTIKFKDGYVKTRVGHEVVSSAEMIKNKGGEFTEALDRLIEIGYAGIEEVKK